MSGPPDARPDPQSEQHAVPSPNIWTSPDVYEIENRGVDPDDAIFAAMRSIHDWAGQRVLDLGCGSGFHLPLLARDAQSAVGVEPHPPLIALARQRLAELGRAELGRAELGRAELGRAELGRAQKPSAGAVVPRAAVLQGAAQAIPLADHCIDVVHARWAYFFGPGCEPGLAELARVLAPGGTAFVIDNDASRSTFGGWFRRAFPAYDPVAIERFWRRQGWTCEPVDIRWEFSSRADFEAVVRIEFEPRVAGEILASHVDLGVDYAVNLWWHTAACP